MRRSHRVAPVVILAALLAVGLVLTLVGCAHGIPEEPVDIEDRELQVEPRATEIEVPTTPVYMGVPNHFRIDAVNPWVHGAFSLSHKGMVGIFLYKQAWDEWGPVGLELYRVRADGTLLYLETLDGTWGVAAATLRSIHGGTYVLKLGGEPLPANLVLELVCMTDTCAPSAQPGEVCGGDAEVECADGLTCRYADGTCHVENRTGVCEVPPQACVMIYDPVCGCDGQTYGNACQALSAGASVDHQGACGPTLCTPYCGNIGGADEGWYDGCSNKLIRLELCGGCEAFCTAIGSRSEGWASTCSSDLIGWAQCSKAELSCVATGGVCAPVIPDACPTGWSPVAASTATSCGDGLVGVQCCMPDGQ